MSKCKVVIGALAISGSKKKVIECLELMASDLAAITQEDLDRICRENSKPKKK